MNGIEKSIARAVASALIANGHKISVDFERGYDCEEQYRDLTDIEKIIEGCDAVDECWFMLDAVHDDGGAAPTNGYVYFIWGNGEEGRTCVSDYTTNLEPLLEPLWDWAENAECVLIPHDHIDRATIAEWRSYQRQGMRSALGEYTPDEFWQLLDAYEALLPVEKEAA